MIEPSGYRPFDAVAKAFIDLARGFVNLANSVAAFPLLGPVLAGGLRGLAGLSAGISSNFYSISAAWDSLAGTISNLSSPAWFVARLEFLFVELKALTKNPWGWLRQKMLDVFGLPASLLYNPGAWIGELITRTFAGWREFISDTRGFISCNWLAAFPAARDLVLTPLTFIRNAMGSALGVPSGLYASPSTWIPWLLDHYFPSWRKIEQSASTWIIDNIGGAYVWFKDFLKDPAGWTLERIRKLLGLPADFFTRWPGAMVDWFWREMKGVAGHVARDVGKFAETVLLELIWPKE